MLRENLTLLGGGAGKEEEILVFQRNNSDITQKNNIRRTMDLQESDYCKGYFLFMKTTYFSLPDIFSRHYLNLIDSFTEAEFLNLCQLMSGPWTSGTSITWEIAGNT